MSNLSPRLPKAPERSQRPISNFGASSFQKILALLAGGIFSVASSLHAQLPPPGDGAPELTAEASRAIDKGLTYLLSVQNKDGSWDSNGE